MPCDIVGDRYIRRSSGDWCDLATGHRVEMTVCPLPSDWPERARTLAEEQASAGRPLLDYGRHGVRQWFETRTVGAHAEPHQPDARCIADEVAAFAASGDARGVQFVAPPVPTGVSSMAAADAVARRLRALGFISVRAGLVLPDACLAHLEHRHLGVLLVDAHDCRGAAHWIRRLSRLSLRGHIVVHLDARTSAPIRSVVARERAPAYWGRDSEAPRDPSPSGMSPAYLGRAACCERRGRRGDAERWCRAALESARRHGNAAGQLAAGRTLVALLRRRDAWTEIVRLTTSLVDEVADENARDEITAMLAGALMVSGQIARADAVVTSAATDSEVRGQVPDARIRIARVQVRFWQGRFEEASRLAADLPPSVEALAWTGLVSWASRDRAALGRVMRAIEQPACAVEGQAFWRSALALLDMSIGLGGPSVSQSARELQAISMRAGDPHLDRLGRVIAREALWAAGQHRAADDALGQEAEWQRAPVLDRLLIDWVQTRRHSVQRGQVTARLVCADAIGIKRWGMESPPMHLIHAIHTVLQLVHDAEDEMAALLVSCAWLRREGGAHAAGFLTAADRAVAAADGWTAADTVDLDLSTASATGGRVMGARGVAVTASVRYAGVEVGWVVARGPADRVATLTDAVQAVAAISAPALRARIDGLMAARQSRTSTPEILGRSPAILALRETIGRAAGTPFSVLIEGESGTGKELVARAIHRLSPRRDRRFCAVNCAAISEELIEAELFGHARGAFTGAIGPRAGLFEEAHTGSLFLDEVSDLSGRAQAKLLRVLQEREVRRVGENAPRPVDVRVIAATNQPLVAAVERSAFREDLLFRLAVVRIRLAPLRERIEDIPLLADACWQSLTLDARKHAVLGPDALASLCRHHWPGNVREFQNVMAALVVLAPLRGRVGARHVTQVIVGATHGDEAIVPLHQVRMRSERQAVTGALARHNGRQTPAARDLGLTRQGLAKAMKRLGLGRATDTAGVA